jgi:hypothetical protein
MEPPQNQEWRWQVKRRRASPTDTTVSLVVLKPTKKKITSCMTKLHRSRGRSRRNKCIRTRQRHKRSNQHNKEEGETEEKDTGLFEDESQGRQRSKNQGRLEIVEQGDKSRDSPKSPTISEDQQHRRLEVKEKKGRKGNRSRKKGGRLTLGNHKLHERREKDGKGTKVPRLQEVIA